jgi:uncharacterized protein (DUF433 family)
LDTEIDDNAHATERFRPSVELTFRYQLGQIEEIFILSRWRLPRSPGCGGCNPVASRLRDYGDYEGATMQFSRITMDPAVMGGKACIRGLRVTVSTVVGLLPSGRTHAEILTAYPYLEPADIDQALEYAAWRLEEREADLAAT